MEQMPPFLKFLTIIIIWSIAAVVSLIQLFFAPAGFFSLAMMAILFGMAIGATALIVNNTDRHQTSRESSRSDRTDTSKRKNDQVGGLSVEMLALLDDDDIAELRQRVKNRLIERIEGGGDGELSSLDALLADQAEPRRKSRR